MAVFRTDIGDVVLISGAYTDDALVPTDPTEATLTIQLEDETETVYRWPTPGIGELAIDHDGAGAFHVDYQPAVSGIVRYRWVGTGAVTSADEDYFFVRQSAFVP